ncbi:MAG: hypothetical protein WA840_23135 [Caulobacteraceae bacterium]
MTEPPPRPGVSNRVSPLAVIIVVILAGLVILVFIRCRAHHPAPSGVKTPILAPQNASG